MLPARYAGQNPLLPVLLLHGLGCSVAVWKPALLHLAQRSPQRQFYAVDLPGCGRSQNPATVLGIAALADWCCRLLDTLGLDQVHVAGTSLGCQVALALARCHPDRVGGLVLGGATEGTDIVPLWRLGLGMGLDVLREPWELNKQVPKMYLQMGIPRFFATVRKMVEDTPVKQADAVQAPCLLVRGCRDAIIPEAAVRQLAAHLPRGTFQAIPGATHAVQFTAPDRFAELALSFWEKVEETTSKDQSFSQIPLPMSAQPRKAGK